jgi:hypothetical protein
MIPLSDLREAHADGAGYCLFCGARNDDLASPYASECDTCGHVAVLPAATILTFLHWVDFEESET